MTPPFFILFMKNIASLILVFFLLMACSSEKNETHGPKARWICLSKQYNEILAALDLESNLVAVDLSSVNPKSIQAIPKVGYHRALAIEPILSFKPTLVIHDNNIAPEGVKDQLIELGVPMVAFQSKGTSVSTTYDLIREMGDYFQVKERAASLVAKMKKELLEAKQDVALYHDIPRVLVLHFGRAKNHYLMVTEKSPAAEVVKLAGGKLCIPGDKAMKMVSSEIIASSNPEVVLITDFGYDRFKNNQGSVVELPGLETTSAYKNQRIYRINEYELMYFGTTLGAQVKKVSSLIHQPAQRQ